MHGAQGDTVDTAHLVASDTTDARTQWTEAFTRDRSDLGPTHATPALLQA